jgi:outer membrane receptor protein involved in Fe transport
VEPSSGPPKGWSASVDWFQFKQRDLINQLGPDFLLAHEDSHPGAIVRNPPAAGNTVGTINYINDTYTNTDSQVYHGYDLGIGYNFKTASLGKFRFSVDATYLVNLELSGDELAGTYEQPKWRAIYSAEWEKGDWAAAVFVSYIGRFDQYAASGTDAAASIPSQTVVNPQISYSGFLKTKITIGVRNALDKNPPFDPHSSTGWNSDIHSPEKLFVYVRLAREF